MQNIYTVHDTNTSTMSESPSHFPGGVDEVATIALVCLESRCWNTKKRRSLSTKKRLTRECGLNLFDSRDIIEIAQFR